MECAIAIVAGDTFRAGVEFDFNKYTIPTVDLY